MIRFIVAVIFVVTFLLLSYLLYPILWIVEKCNKKAKDYASLRIVQWGFKVVLFISGTNVTVIGKENMPNEATLYVGNHRSFFDILIMCTQYKELMGFVAKDSLGKIPSLRIWMRYIYCLFLDRKDIKQGMKTILQAIEYIKQGVSIAIFPEGTRNTGEEFSMLPFKEGSFKIALKTGCPIVPVAINNSAEIFENHLPKIKKTHVVIEYGKPIYPSELDNDEKKHVGVTCQNIIREMLQVNFKLV